VADVFLAARVVPQKQIAAEFFDRSFNGPIFAA
jgi:hypothetical protein